MGKALNHALSHWLKLIRYVQDGHTTLDNSTAENAIHPFVIREKTGSSRASHPNGARADATLYSLIEKAKNCGLAVYRYPRFLFERLPCAQ